MQVNVWRISINCRSAQRDAGKHDTELLGQSSVISPPLCVDSKGGDASVKINFQGPADTGDEA